MTTTQKMAKIFTELKKQVPADKDFAILIFPKSDSGFMHLASSRAPEDMVEILLEASEKVSSKQFFPTINEN